MKADAQTLAFNQQIETLMGQGPAWESLSAPELREYLLTSPLAAPPMDVPEAGDRSIPGPAGDIPIRVMVPEGPLNGVYLHIHGGESAGAHLTVMTLLRMRDNHNYTGFRGAALTYGVFDLRGSPSARAFGDRRLTVNTPVVEWFGNHYVEKVGVCRQRDRTARLLGRYPCVRRFPDPDRHRSRSSLPDELGCRLLLGTTAGALHAPQRRARLAKPPGLLSVMLP